MTKGDEGKAGINGGIREQRRSERRRRKKRPNIGREAEGWTGAKKNKQSKGETK